MKHAGLLLLLTLTLSSPSLAGEEVAHELRVELEPSTHALHVVDRIELPEAWRAAGSEFTLAQELELDESSPAVSVVGAAGEFATRYRLDAAAADGSLTLRYHGTIDSGLSDQKEEYTRGMRDTRGIVGPEGVYLDGGSDWVASFGEGMLRFELEVTQPAGWHVISQGSGSSRDASGKAVWSSGGLLEQVYLVGGPLTVEHDAAGSVETLVYLHEADAALSRKYLEATARYLEMYRKLIGPYPYGKFALVENFWETGYGMPSFTLLGEQVIRLPFILHSSYPHEILHNWWGNSVFVDYASGNWCEGLTAYLADHLIQEQRGLGADYRRASLQKYRDYVREGLDFPLQEFHNRHSAATEAVGYGKSLMMFHMLRRRLGDELFTAGLADIYRRQRGQRASFDDLRASFEAVSKQELGAFFEQWVERTGAPALALRDVRVERDGDDFLVRGRVEQVQEAAPYMLAVPLEITTAEGARSFTLEVAGASQAFEYRLTASPSRLVLDPDFDLFRLLDARETPSSIGQLFGEAEVLAVLPRTDSEAYRALMEGWQSESHHIELLLEDELDELPSDRTVWLLGPENRFALALAGAAPEPVEVPDARTLTLAGEPIARERHSSVVTWRHPGNVEKAVGWLCVDPAEAFAGMGRKLPHYGKYSYLAFEGEEPTNVVKGQWPASGSPLVARLAAEGDSPAVPRATPARAALAELPPVFSTRAMMAHVNWLADPAREGRGLGTHGLDAAADYIAERMAAAGLEPGGQDGSWFQAFTVAEGPDGTPVEARNVIGILPGTKAEWGTQSVVLSAHYDHLGRGWPDAHASEAGQLHPGADDNASGVAVLLELAQNLAAEGEHSRNLVFAAFSAEECGLVGSRAYVHSPNFPLAGLRGVINMDTVGRLNAGKIAIHGTGTADEWQHIFRGCGFVTGIDSLNVPGSAEGSDQESFIEAGIPAVQIFTGAHADYHRVGDTPDKVDGAGLVRVASFVKEAVVYMLEREEPLSIRIEGVSNEASAGARTSGRKVSFGTVPEFAFQGSGVQVASVVPGSPAEKAGVLAGDVLVQVASQEIADLRAFSEVLGGLEAGQTVLVTLLRGGQTVTLEVTVVAR